MPTISALGRRFGLSRSTLLYYDRIGLLRPGGRSAKAYRHYGEAEVARLEQICLYRRAGVPLAEIRRLLDGAGRPFRRSWSGAWRPWSGRSGPSGTSSG